MKEYFDMMLKRIEGKQLTFNDAMLFDSVVDIDTWVLNYTKAIELHIKGGTLTREACANITKLFISSFEEDISDPTKREQRENLQYLKTKLSTLLLMLQTEVVSVQKICSSIPQSLLSDIFRKFNQYLAYDSEEEFIDAVYDDKPIEYVGKVKSNLCSVFSEALRRLKENNAMSFEHTKIVETLFKGMPNKEIQVGSKPIHNEIHSFFQEFDPQKYVT